MNQMKPDLEEVFLIDSQVGSVKERDHLKSLSIMKHHPKAYLVLNQKPRESTHLTLCKTAQKSNISYGFTFR